MADISTIYQSGNVLIIRFDDGTVKYAYRSGKWWLVSSSYTPPEPPAQGWIWPVDYHSGIFVSQEFDNGVNHTGIDITYSGIEGASIHAIADSTVVDKGFTSSNGNIIKLQAFDGSYYEFYHMESATTLSIGDAVSMGDTVGFVGETGSNATGPHCHMGTSESGWPGLQATFSDMENPRTYMSNRGAPYPW